MNKTLLVSGLAALTLAAAGGAAFAQQAPARTMRADTDGDSRLNRAEFVNRRVERLTAMDTNRDGSVSVEERRAAMQARMAVRADARFERLDANDDGAVSRAEFDAAREAGREARADRGPHPMRAHRGPGHGQRGMGRMESRGPVVIADVQARAEQAFARLDADNDGFVTAAEGRAGRQAVRDQRRERMTERRSARQAQRQASPQAPASE
ncbi:MAG: EF-hand domain-containing protein [Brevundimonas sp.]|uniref:EF-hand domain-containing protein n=1 Tax=Brevundimonas sp. TaxID=1871086 RepID=UPI00271B7574|nr:EF-hand domain-containing protein [Brevundimonas sp.]MDO9586397.1 EF-hand domain-containing protein [Brevundimonas sp.]